MKTTADLAQHVSALAAAFHVKLDVRKIDPAAAGAGDVVMLCDTCGQKNRVRRQGTVRCGRCKAPLGHVVENRTIVIAPVTCEATYAVAMHELGHCIHPTGRVRDTEGSLKTRTTNEIATLRDMHLLLLEETSAWDWAQTNALDWTTAMQQVKTIALGSYEQHARFLGLKVRTV